VGRAIGQAVSRQVPTAAGRARYHVRSYGICGGRSETEASFPLKSSVYHVYQLLHHTETLHSTQRAYLCVPCGFRSKQRLSPQTALTGWYL
jgi:hypothetical protein